MSINLPLPLEIRQLVENFFVTLDPIRHSVPALIRAGNLAGLQWYEDNGLPIYRPTQYSLLWYTPVEYAAWTGNLASLKWLQRRFPTTSKAFDTAAAMARLDILEWLHGQGYRGTSMAMDMAAQNGHLPCVIWLHRRGYNCTTSAMDFAAENNHIEVVKWLDANRTEGCTTDAVDYALFFGHLEMVTWLLRHRSEGFTGEALIRAHRLGQHDILRLMQSPVFWGNGLMS